MKERRPRAFASEAALAAKVVEWLGSTPYEIYQEVQMGRAGPVADIVARSGNIIWVIETKLSLGLAVFGQAEEWREFAHYVSVAVPHRIGDRGDHAIVSRLCAMTGIGLLYANLFDASERFRPKLNRRISSYLRDSLCDAQKTFAAAGNAESLRWTPWRQTCRNLAEAVGKSPGIKFKDLIESLDHHYATIASAKSSLSKWIALGKVPGVRLERDGRHLVAFPDIENATTPSHGLNPS